ncbi:hypothetical protein JCM11251_000531 [Rhodosporidiobolus azoricus]
MWPASQPWRGPTAGPSAWPSTSSSVHGVYASSDPRGQPLPVYHPYAQTVPTPPHQAQSTLTEQPYGSRILTRQRSSSNDVGFHPYKVSSKPATSTSPPPASKPILFVDTTQQASGQGDAAHQCRPKRKRITPEQLVRLTSVFETTDSPSYDVRDKIGAEIGMTNREVQVWFQNRRAKVNRQRQAALAKEQSERAAAMMSQAAAAVAQPKVPVETMSAGQHQWRFRTGARGPYVPPQPQQPVYPSSTTMGPPSPRRAAIPAPFPPPPPHGQRQPFPPQPSPFYPASTSHPQLSPFPTPSAYSPHLSPSLVHGPNSGPSYFPITSPALSTATPSLASPGSVASSYFSRNEGPFTPSTTISSPSNTLFRLTLESPRVTPLSPHSVPGTYEPPSPDLDISDAPIHLAPIRNLHYRIRPGSSKAATRPQHRRSISDSAAHASFLPPRPIVTPVPLAAEPTSSAASPGPAKLVRLPSLRGLLNDDEEHSSPPLGISSAPASPVDAINPLPLSPALAAESSVSRTTPLTSRPFPRQPARSASPVAIPPRPRLVSRYSTMDIHSSSLAERRPTPVDTSSQMHDDEGVVVPPASASPPLGLGMLCAAATEMSEGDEKAQRLVEAQRMR